MKRLMIGVALLALTTTLHAENIFSVTATAEGMTGFGVFHYKNTGKVGMYGSYAADWSDPDGYIIGESHIWHYTITERNVDYTYELFNLGVTYRTNNEIGLYAGFGIGGKQPWHNATDDITCGGACREPDGKIKGNYTNSLSLNVGAHYMIDNVAFEIGYNSLRNDVYAGLGFIF